MNLASCKSPVGDIESISEDSVTNIAETTRQRDREATSRRLLDAMRAELIESGYDALGVNTIARRAGCDKQLIYRYFGGLDGMIEAFGREMSGWVIRALEGSRMPSEASYGDVIKASLCALLDALRADPAMVQLIGSETRQPSPQVLRMAAERGRELSSWVENQTRDLPRPEGRDAPAINAVLIAAIQHLVLAATATKRFAGLTLDDDGDWQRVRSAICLLVDTAYAPSRST
jgi:AcrR family transcriptional regulator